MKTLGKYFKLTVSCKLLQSFSSCSRPGVSTVGTQLRNYSVSLYERKWVQVQTVARSAHFPGRVLCLTGCHLFFGALKNTALLFWGKDSMVLVRNWTVWKSARRTSKPPRIPPCGGDHRGVLRPPFGQPWAHLPRTAICVVCVCRLPLLPLPVTRTPPHFRGSCPSRPPPYSTDVRSTCNSSPSTPGCAVSRLQVCP